MDTAPPHKEDFSDNIASAFAEYSGDCILTLSVIFEQPEKSSDLQSWLYEVGIDEDLMTDLMHDEPIQTVARYLGVDRSGDSFLALNQRYRAFVHQK